MADERMSVVKILADIKPEINFEAIDDIIDGDYLDSFELINLIASLEGKFGIKIGANLISPENFNSVDTITALVTKLNNN